MVVEISILVACLFVMVFIGMAIASGFDSILVYILSVIFTPVALVLVGYLYALILEKFFNFHSTSEVLTYGFMWFLGLAILLMFGAFAPTHTTKSGKADKRYKDNPAVAAGMGVYLFLVLAWSGILCYLLAKTLGIF